MAKVILVIEDETSMLNILAHKLEEQGFEVLKAEDGEKGLELAKSGHPDLVLLDLLLPKLGGLDMLDKLRESETGKTVPVFIISNLSSNDAIYKSVSLKADAYFIKSDSSLEHITEEVKKKLA